MVEKKSENLLSIRNFDFLSKGFLSFSLFLRERPLRQVIIPLFYKLTTTVDSDDYCIVRKEK